MQGCSPSSLAAGALTMALSFPSAAPQGISFVWLMLAGLRSVVGWVRGGRTLRIACAGECRPQSRGARDSPCTSPCCRLSQAPFSLSLSFFLFLFVTDYSFIFFMFCFSSVVKQWLEGVKVHLGSGKQCPWPATEIEQIYKNLSQLFCSVLRNWQDCQEEEVSTAAFPARDGSGDIRVGSSVCAQRAESRRVTRGSGLALQRAPSWLCAWGWISLPGSSRMSQHCGRDSWGRRCGEKLPALQSEPISCWAWGYGEREGKAKTFLL